jgi:NAD(P)-dependent dehydrogenase (short-subunit alcohol dehydrogenase family)
MMKIYLITGAAGNIGNSITRSLLTDPQSTVIGVDIKDLPDLKIREMGTRYKHLKCDILDLDGLRAVAGQITDEYGHLNGLVNCFYAPESKIVSTFNIENVDELDRPGPIRSKAVIDAFLNFGSKDFLSELEINIVGLHNVVLAFSNLLVSTPNSSVVNLASQYGIKVPNQDLFTNRGKFVMKLPGYSTSKAAVISYTEYLASIYSYPNENHVRFNAIAPGNLFQNHAIDFVEKYRTFNWSNRMASAEDVAAATLFLLSEAAGYINGTTLEVDSGWSRR